jgi:sigma-B regulation protein RsbU (phosphoserine phosphatase)
VKLSIRWKLLILLLVIALVPLAVVTYIGQRGARQLGTDFADQAGSIVARDAQNHLQAIVEHAARTLYRQRQLIELALMQQALQVEARLAHRPREGVTVLFDTDFDNPTGLSAPMQPSQKHFMLTPEGRRQPLLVSYVTQVVRLAPGLAAEDVAMDIARLADMTAAYRPLQQTYSDLVYWQFTALESGVHTSYPGKGGYPEDFDARTRPWYLTGKADGGPTWSVPTRDATTGNVMMACVMPVRRPDGSFAGVTAIDVSLGELLRNVAPPSSWRQEAESMLVLADTELSPTSPLILVDMRDDDAHDRSWREALQSRPLQADEASQSQAILTDMQVGRANVRQITRGGREWFCAYGPVTDAGSFFLVMVPHDLILADAMRITEQMQARTHRQLQITGAIALGVIVLTVVTGLLASRHFTRPVQRLADAADRIASGDLESRVEIRTGDEFEKLGLAFNRMVPKLRDLLQVRQSLALAMEVQQSLLPAAAPQVPGLDIAGHSIYCDETGGDYYDFLTVEELSPNIVGIAVGDVTGHGIAAALLMATARALIRSHTEDPQPLADIFTRVNRHLSIDRLPGRFMTLFCCILDTKAKRVRWTSAGHDPAIVYHPDRDVFETWEGEDLPLGIDPTWQYHETSLTQWTPGAVVVIGTDGIWECRNDQMEQFGKERLRELIRQHASATAEQISRVITDAVKAYRGKRMQEDDITLVVIKLL